jgi:crossover junction endodeoxyribonuclease RuvC
MPTNERTILGIDPGTTIMGYAVITSKGKNPCLLDFGVLHLSKLPDHFEKLKTIFETTTCLIDKYKVQELSIEAPFFGKNVQSMLKLGRAQGVAISAALSRGLAVTEYAPRKIKMAITGQGNASKEQVAFLLQKMLNLAEIPKDLDATDALAAALCHFYQYRGTETTATFKSWKDFLGKNPDRIKS